MSDKPMLFTGPMVRAMLEGRKTQTRRLIKLNGQKPDFIGGVGMEGDPTYWGWEHPDGGHITVGDCRDSVMNWSDWRGAYRVGDRLWVRETHAVVPSSAYRCSEGVQQTVNSRDVDMAAIYACGWERCAPRWRSSIHMPRWASRLTLIVENVRVQQLQDISEDDAVAEGIERMKSGRGFYDPTVSKGAVRAGIWHHKATEPFHVLWNSLNARRAPWASNPWVVALTFRAINANIDRLEATP